MELIDLIKKRFSVRSFLDKPVDDETILKVLEAGRWAPSACNIQPWTFIVIREETSKRKLETVYGKSWFLEAPVIIAACCDHKTSWKRFDGKDYGDVDIAIAFDHIVLAATELGLGTCWVGAFKSREASEILRLPENITPVAFTPLGYIASEKPLKSRKNLDEIVSWEFFGGKR